jgi:hypothetical protein
VYVTRGGSVQRLLISGPNGWPTGETPWLAGPTLQRLTDWLHCDTLQEAVEENPKLKVSGGETPWSANHMDRPASHHLACYQLNQVGNPALDPNKYPPRWKSKQHTLHVFLHL